MMMENRDILCAFLIAYTTLDTPTSKINILSKIKIICLYKAARIFFFPD